MTLEENPVLWQQILSTVAAKTSPDLYGTWFQPLRALQRDNASLEIEFPNETFQTVFCEGLTITSLKNI